MERPTWVENKVKYNRAVAELGVDAPEEKIKARYIEMLGRVRVEAPADAPKKEKKPKRKKK